MCAGIRNVCRGLTLFTQASVAVGSPKFEAVRSPDRNLTPTKIDKRQQRFDESIRHHPSALGTADRTLPLSEFAPRSAQLKVKIATLRAQMRRIMNCMREQSMQQPDEQLPLTDPEARSMMLQVKGTGLAGCKVHAVVEDKHH